VIRTSVAVLLLMAISPAVARDATVRLEAVKDNSIVLYPGEMHLNAGAKKQIRIKGNQHIVALDFDAGPIRGKVVRRAVLVCAKGAEEIDGVTVSTIQADWDEGKSNALTAGFGGVEGWGWPGARFPAVTGGNSFSLTCSAPSEVVDGAYRWEIDPDLVHALAVGAAHGLTVHEWSSDYSRNPTIWSREGPKEKRPHLLVELGGKAEKPEPPEIVTVRDVGDPEGSRLVLRARRGFAYVVQVNGRDLPRWNVPFVRPGTEQVVPIRDTGLLPGERARIEVATVNRAGMRSRSVSTKFRIPALRAIDDVAVPEIEGHEPAVPGLFVVPVADKYDLEGKPVGGLPPDHRVKNAVFDGRTIRLRAARGEVVGFNAILRGEGQVGIEAKIPGLRTEVRTALYVACGKRRIPDPLVPLDRLGLSKDRDAMVCADVFVPFDAKKREYEGSLRISDGRSLPIQVAVRDFALPRKASFLCEMNTYGVPDTVALYERYQEIAYDHRVHLNFLHYGHRSSAPGARKCVLDMRLPSGRRMDERRYNAIEPGGRKGFWDDFVAAFGPLLTGRHFAKGHRGPVPLPGFYLTFHESWPLHVRAFFDGNPDAYEAFAKSPEYAETFVAVLRDFLLRANREGFGAGFQVYLNNKGSLRDETRAPWVLYEPTGYHDYRALAFYADLVRTATGVKCPVTLRYRIDISRPQFTRGELRGKADLWVVGNSAFRAYPRILADRRERTGEEMWVYGTSNRVEASNRTILAWVLEAYGGGARGVVPWQTVDRKGGALSKGDPLGLFIFDRATGAIHHSLRLKAYRRAEQDVEYLTLLREKFDYTEDQLRGFIDRHLELDGDVRKTSEADAGTPRYDRLPPAAFRTLRESAAALIEEP